MTDRVLTPRDLIARIAERLRVSAFDYPDRSPRERRALERARRDYPGRAHELRRLESLQRWMRSVDRRPR